MAAAQVFNQTYLGLKSGRTYPVLGYSADTASYINTYSMSGTPGATSLTYLRFPEPVALIDFAIPTGTTQTSMVMTENGATKNGAVLGFATNLNTSANRAKLNIPFEAGALIGSMTI